MASDRLATLCATCGERILTIEWTEGNERRWELRHWSGIDEAHEPVPAPVAAEHAPLRCDFCGAPGPKWAFETRFATRVISYSEHDVVTHETDEPWAACAPCKRYVVKRDVDRMLHRLMLTVEKRLGDEPFAREAVEEEARCNWEAFFLADPGKPTRIGAHPPSDD